LISSKSITFFLKSLEYGTGIVFARILFSWRKKCKLNLIGYKRLETIQATSTPPQTAVGGASASSHMGPDQRCK